MPARLSRNDLFCTISSLDSRGDKHDVGMCVLPSRDNSTDGELQSANLRHAIMPSYKLKEVIRRALDAGRRGDGSSVHEATQPSGGARNIMMIHYRLLHDWVP